MPRVQYVYSLSLVSKKGYVLMKKCLTLFTILLVVLLTFYVGDADVNRENHILRAPEGMVLIPAGKFQMGSDSDEAMDNERPVHTVYIDAFYIDKHEVTNAQYKKFVDANPQWQKDSIQDVYHNGDYLASWNGNNYPKGKDDHPVVFISWHAAMAYAKWAGKRLPTEAEWEKAARGRRIDQKYPWGNSIDIRKTNYGGFVGNTTPVGKYPPNGYGVFDMAGNVKEWCLDKFENNFYKISPSHNPVSGENVMDLTHTKGFRVLRGGSWSSPARSSLVFHRFGWAPSGAFSQNGFRCVKVVSP
ncbi:formylglycine-generating enzyme family protein [Candidatus Poribacteria bacterium]|nr:formylglycine-generating enzyme family protein [Candidatus Poribacteria bacterium]MYG08680.1 formylglycine-generating enzyme family protein [Candidatus Poribacteria bacterium]MYK20955.1 formylglycine-generating enzyme family protein [Candidatus Poribacteria bacterium]